MTDSKLNLEICNLKFNSPVSLLSGCVGFGNEYTRVEGFSHDKVGAVFLKGTTLERRLGNSGQRICETAEGMLNSIGLQNPGADKVIREILPQLDFSKTRYIANINGTTIEEYQKITQLFDDSPVDAIEINISCPNVEQGGVLFGTDPQMSAKVVEACRQQTDKPLITKLTPNQTDIAGNAKLCIEAGSDALAVVNTYVGMEINIETQRPVIGMNKAGLSGSAIKPMALLAVHQVYQVAKRHTVPIIGQGGIKTAEDAIAFLLAGASSAGIGTALFYDPLICNKINEGVVAYLKRHNLSNVSELCGRLTLNT